MTRLISNSTRSSRAASTDGGTGEPGTAGEVSIGLLAAVLTGLPGRAGRRPPGRSGCRRGGRAVPRASVLHRLDPGRGTGSTFPGSHLRVSGQAFTNPARGAA